MSIARVVRCSYIGFRLLRYRLSPWIVLASASLKLLFIAGSDALPARQSQRTREQIRCMRAMSKIDFVNFYRAIEDLLW
jgi:hypothetical protein